MGASAFVVFLEAGLEVGCEADVVLGGVGFAYEDVDIVVAGKFVNCRINFTPPFS